MKKILLSLVICLGLVSFANQTFAQSSTALAPFNGATHTYTFQNVEANAQYEFFVTTTNNYAAGPDNTFGSFVGAASGPVGVSDADVAVQIQWAGNATDQAGGYYLFLKVFTPSAGVGDCESANYKSVHIVPVLNSFNVDIADAVTPDPSCADLDATFSPLVTVAGDGTNSGYNAGKTTLKFTVSPKNSAPSDQWSFQFDIAALNAPTFTWSVNGGAVTGDELTVADIASTAVSAPSTDIVIVFDNQPGLSPAFTIHFDSARNITTLTDALTDQLPVDETHTVKVMPSIGDFVGN